MNQFVWKQKFKLDVGEFLLDYVYKGDFMSAWTS